MIELSVIRDLVAIFGVIAGFSYYVLTVRNAQKSQRLTEESREIQVISGYFQTEEDNKRLIELVNMEWADYDDFEMKYGSDNNPDNYSKRATVWNQLNTLGYLVKKGLVAKEPVFELMGVIPYVYWSKFVDVIIEIRRRYNQPLYGLYFEYLAEESVKYMQDRGIDTSVSDTFYSYVPDQ
ncbi:MAG: hypothetical protein NWE89_11285 [Candidatus Bathyarchaeota archaeon]|nr:hypothetical protein [Candidatus Bathyarchaeota archaeon]